MSAERGVQLADFEAQSLALAAEGCLPSGLALEAGEDRHGTGESM